MEYGKVRIMERREFKYVSMPIESMKKAIQFPIFCNSKVDPSKLLWGVSIVYLPGMYLDGDYNMTTPSSRLHRPQYQPLERKGYETHTRNRKDVICLWLVYDHDHFVVHGAGVTYCTNSMPKGFDHRSFFEAGTEPSNFLYITDEAESGMFHAHYPTRDEITRLLEVFAYNFTTFNDAGVRFGFDFAHHRKIRLFSQRDILRISRNMAKINKAVCRPFVDLRIHIKATDPDPQQAYINQLMGEDWQELDFPSKGLDDILKRSDTDTSEQSQENSPETPPKEILRKDVSCYV